MNKTDIWCFKYAPQTFNDLVLNEHTKEIIKPLLSNFQNSILYGTPGVGKGSFVNILLKESQADFIKINGCDENSVDTFREKIKSFGTTMSMSDSPKIIYINEAERLLENAAAAQPLKDFMETVQCITRFIFILNRFSAAPKEIISRCQIFEFLPAPISEIGKFCLNILKQENIKINPNTLKTIIGKCYPDIRWTINTIQQNCINGVMVDKPIFSDDIYKEIFNSIMKKDVDAIRLILRTKSIDYPELYKYIFDNVESFKSPGDAIIEIGERLYRDSTVAIKEINFIAGIMVMMKQGVI